MSSLYQIVIVHHDQARHMARRTQRQRAWKDHDLYPSCVDELRRVGRKFTTRVEKRLRRLETNGT